ncbi:addiction module protein [Sulfuriferula sp.]|uniref:addiction module protein n=1 Tax=Sulfuriferula sp. TaxID=2025307 RepID=UPI00273183FF|nr:addiction module protein [Sulfuriferula sp.]MDP2025590.1 addiction module protein [Sulfuriferula sp.]
MGHVLQELGIDQLPVEQRMELVQEIWDSIAHEMGLLSPTPEERGELESRMAEDGTSPAGVSIWDEIKSDALKRWQP